MSVWTLLKPIARCCPNIHLEGLYENHTTIGVKKINLLYLISVPKLEPYGLLISRIEVAHIFVWISLFHRPLYLRGVSFISHFEEFRGFPQFRDFIDILN
jgi:hypothetical protein